MSTWWLGDPRRAAVEVEVRLVVELADLAIADLVDDVTVAERQIAPAGAVRGLEDGVVVAGLLEFPGRGEADAATEDDDVAAFASRLRTLAASAVGWWR